MKALHIMLALTLLGFQACKSDNSSENGASSTDANPNQIVLSPAQMQQGGVVVAPTELKSLSSSIPATGMLEIPPQQRISVTAPMAGYIKSTKLLEGMHVHKGEVLAEVQHPDVIRLQEDYLETAEKLKLADLDLKRQQQLQSGDAGIQRNLQTAQAEYNSLAARLSGLRSRLALIGIDAVSIQRESISGVYTIRAAQEGYVTAVNVHLGKFAAPQDVLFELIDNSHMHAELQVTEKYAHLLREGQSIRFELTNQPGTFYTASVYLIGKNLSENRTVRVHGHLESDHASFLPGLFLNARIETGHDSLAAVPQAAVVRFGGSDVVLEELKSGTFRPVAVDVLANEQGWSGIKAKDGRNLSGMRCVTQGTAMVIGVLTNPSEEE